MLNNLVSESTLMAIYFIFGSVGLAFFLCVPMMLSASMGYNPFFNDKNYNLDNRVEERRLIAELYQLGGSTAVGAYHEIMHSSKLEQQ